MNFLKQIDDFTRGQQDAEDGHPSKHNQSKDYYSGYNLSYQAQQILDHQTEKQDERIARQAK